MPPKGVLKTPSELGSVQQIKDGWRFVLPAMHDLREHTNTSGPVRQTKAKADKDKANARMCKSRKQMLEFVRGLRTGTCGGGVHPATDDILAVEAIAPAGSSADLAWSEDDTAAVEEHAEGGHFTTLTGSGSSFVDRDHITPHKQCTMREGATPLVHKFLVHC